MALVPLKTTAFVRDYQGTGSIGFVQAYAVPSAPMMLESGCQKDGGALFDTSEVHTREIMIGNIPLKDTTNTAAAVQNLPRPSSPTGDYVTQICNLTAANTRLNLALEDLRHSLEFQIKKTQYKEAQLRGIDKDRASLRADVEHLKQEVEKKKDALDAQADHSKSLEDKLQNEISLLHKITATFNDRKAGVRLQNKHLINGKPGMISDQDQLKHGNSAVGAVQRVMEADLRGRPESPIDTLISRYFPLVQIGLLVRGRFLEDSLRRCHLQNSTRYMAHDRTLVVKGDCAIHEPDYLADLALYQSHFLDPEKDKLLFEQVYAGSLEQHLAQVSSIRSTESERIDIMALWFSARAQIAIGSRRGGTMFTNLFRRVADSDRAVSQTIVSIVQRHHGYSHENINTVIEADKFIKQKMDEMRGRTEELRHRIYKNGFQ